MLRTCIPTCYLHPGSPFLWCSEYLFFLGGGCSQQPLQNSKGFSHEGGKGEMLNKLFPNELWCQLETGRKSHILSRSVLCESTDLCVSSLHPLPLVHYTHTVLICSLFCILSALSPKHFGKVQISVLTAQCSRRKGEKQRTERVLKGKHLLLYPRTEHCAVDLESCLFFFSFFVSWFLKSNICCLLKESSAETHSGYSLTLASIRTGTIISLAFFLSFRLLTMQVSSPEALSHSPTS